MLLDVLVNEGIFLFGQHGDDAVDIERVVATKVIIYVLNSISKGVQFHQEECECLRNIYGHRACLFVRSDAIEPECK